MLHARNKEEMYTEFWWEMPDGRRLLGRTTYEWVDSIEMEHIQIFTELFEVDYLAGFKVY
jgi:hypothetical protein